MRKAYLQSIFQLDPHEKQLKDYQPGKRCGLLIFETERRNFMECCRNLCFTIFHLKWLPELG
jgi:hypothetical protein